MKLLEQFIAQTGRQPADWTSQDIQKYLHYVEKQAAEAGLAGIAVPDEELLHTLPEDLPSRIAVARMPSPGGV